MSTTLVYLCNISVAAPWKSQHEELQASTYVCVCISACLLVCPALWPALPFGLDCSGLQYDKYSKSAKEHHAAPFELCLTPSSCTAGAYLTCNCICCTCWCCLGARGCTYDTHANAHTQRHRNKIRNAAHLRGKLSRKWNGSRKRRRRLQRARWCRCNAFIIFQRRQIKKRLTHSHFALYGYHEAGISRKYSAGWITDQRLWLSVASCTCRIFSKFRPSCRYMALCGGGKPLVKFEHWCVNSPIPKCSDAQCSTSSCERARAAACGACNTNSKSGNNTRYQQPVQICLRHCQTSKQFVPDSANKQTTDGLTDGRTDWLTDRVLGK